MVAKEIGIEAINLITHSLTDITYKTVEPSHYENYKSCKI